MGDSGLAQRFGGEWKPGSSEEDDCRRVVDVEPMKGRRHEGEVGAGGDLHLVDGDQQAAVG